MKNFCSTTDFVVFCVCRKFVCFLYGGITSRNVFSMNLIEWGSVYLKVYTNLANSTQMIFNP